eukprot:jgi/Psemu1/301258/fgenesh1_kg.28_\
MKLVSLLSLLFSVMSTYALALQPAKAFTSSTRSSASRNVALGMAAGTVEAPAVLDRPATKKDTTPSKERYREGGETWEVRIYNDGDNTREHVARALVQITGMAEMMAYQTMMTAHQNGIASVGMFAFEVAEVYNEGLRKQGIVSDIIPVDEDFQ